MILNAQNISKSYIDVSEKLNVLENLNLKISDPEITVINGPSGSGKPTFLNI